MVLGRLRGVCRWARTSRFFVLVERPVVVIVFDDYILGQFSG